jgi:phage FluMu protein Com
MQIRCQQCHRPFAIGRDEIHTALALLFDEDLAHYNAQCPHCRKVNRISRDELLRTAPDWKREETEKEE